MIESVLRKFNDTLKKMELEVINQLDKAEEGIKITKLALEELQKIVIKTSFKSKVEEIKFFKKVKPQIVSKIIYYQILFNIESKRPRSSNKSQKKYLNDYIDKLQVYFGDNLEFYHYCRRGSTFFDEQYFLRGNIDNNLHIETFYFFTNKQFSTSHDSVLSTILAYDLLIIYLKGEMNKLENTNGIEKEISSIQKQAKLVWTGNKTDLIELIYALHSSGTVNSGTADIKEMATICEQMFNINLGDYYRTFLEIRSRKINQTKFIDKLKDSLINKMLESDE